MIRVCETVEEKPKKPIYKRVWFWLLIVLVVVPALGKSIDAVRDRAEPPERMINEDRVAEQSEKLEQMQQEENEPEPVSAEDRAKASVEQLISDTFRGTHYSCELSPYEGDFGYAATIVLDVPDSYADDPDTLLDGLGNTIASQSDSQIVWLNLTGYYDNEVVYEASGYFNQRLYFDVPDEEQTSSSSGAAQTVTYVLNTNSMVFHKSTCNDVDEIARENKSTFSGTRTGAINAGYSPCGHCDP